MRCSASAAETVVLPRLGAFASTFAVSTPHYAHAKEIYCRQDGLQLGGKEGDLL